MTDSIRFPIGAFQPLLKISFEERNNIIKQIPDLTGSLREILNTLDREQLQTPYRPGGWTPQQIVHHMADNDLNAYFRFKRALTEEAPAIDSYREDLFAELPDYKTVPIETSILLLEALHARFLSLLNALSPVDFGRAMKTHALGEITLDTALQRFVWHNRHHMSQIKFVTDRSNTEENDKDSIKKLER